MRKAGAGISMEREKWMPIWGGLTLLSYAVQIIRSPNENLIVDGNRTGQRQPVQLVHSQNLKFRPSLYHRCRSFFVDAINLAVGQERGCAVGPPLDPLALIHDLARG